MGNSPPQMKVEKVKDNVLKTYNTIRDNPARASSQANFKILKSTRVRPSAVVASLNEFSAHCQDKKLRDDIAEVKPLITNSLAGGTTKLFVMATDSSENLEFVCLALRYYNVSDKLVCDYCMSKFSCQSGGSAIQLIGGASVREIVEANFLHELVERGHATISSQGDLYLCPN